MSAKASSPNEDIWPMTPVHPGTKLWRLPVEVTQFRHPRSGFGALFCMTKKIILIKRRGNSMKQKLLEIFQVAVWLHTDELFLSGFKKTKTCAKTAPRARKLSYLDGRAPQLSARVNHGTQPRTALIGHRSKNFSFFAHLYRY